MRAHFLETGQITEDDIEAAEFGDDLDGPDIPAGYHIFWIAWHVLKDDRQFGAMGGAGNIYYASISQYARDYGMDDEEREELLRLMRAMDAEYLSWLAERKAESQQQNKPDAPT